MEAVEKAAEKHDQKLTAKRLGLLKNALAERDEDARPVLRKVHKAGKAAVDSTYGLYASPIGDPSLVVEYEPDTELRDTEQVPLLEPGGIELLPARGASACLRCLDRRVGDPDRLRDLLYALFYKPSPCGRSMRFGVILKPSGRSGRSTREYRWAGYFGRRRACIGGNCQAILDSSAGAYAEEEG